MQQAGAAGSAAAAHLCAAAARIRGLVAGVRSQQLGGAPSGAAALTARKGMRSRARDARGWEGPSGLRAESRSHSSPSFALTSVREPLVCAPRVRALCAVEYVGGAWSSKWVQTSVYGREPPLMANTIRCPMIFFALLMGNTEWAEELSNWNSWYKEVPWRCTLFPNAPRVRDCRDG